MIGQWIPPARSCSIHHIWHEEEKIEVKTETFGSEGAISRSQSLIYYHWSHYSLNASLKLYFECWGKILLHRTNILQVEWWKYKLHKSFNKVLLVTESSYREMIGHTNSHSGSQASAQPRSWSTLPRKIVPFHFVPFYFVLSTSRVYTCRASHFTDRPILDFVKTNYPREKKLMNVLKIQLCRNQFNSEGWIWIWDRIIPYFPLFFRIERESLYEEHC